VIVTGDWLDIRTRARRITAGLAGRRIAGEINARMEIGSSP